MIKRIQKILSACLAAVMLMNMLPLSVFAENIQNQQKPEAAMQESVLDEVHIVEEIVDQRTEYSKQFRLNNGLCLSTVYAVPVHYMADGKWAEIDNTLQLASAESGECYTNTAGSWKISFPKNMTDGSAVTVAKDGYSINFQMAGEVLRAKQDHPVEIEEADRFAAEELQEEIPAETPEIEELSDDNAEEEKAPAEAELAEGLLEAEDFENAQAVESGEKVQKEDLIAEEAVVLSVPADNTAAQIETVDLKQVKAQAEYAETVADKISSRLRYARVFEGTDVIYDLDSNRMKESIVMEAYRDGLCGYSFTLNVGELIPVLLENGDIELRDSDGKDVVMYMPAPYLLDADGATCFDVKVVLKGEGSRYVLNYELPQKWLQDSGRKWPVILDPAVLANTNVNNIKDTTVYTRTYLDHTRGILALGYYTDRGLARSYIKYQNLPNLTAADVIVSASLTMYKPYNSATVTSTIEVHKVNSDWASETITWNTQPAINPIVEDFVICKAAGFYTWDITDIARSWYEDANYGLMLKYPDAAENVTTASWKEFYSSEGAVAPYLPNVMIVFRNNNGVESYWDYSAASAGRAGTGYVNQYTGNLAWIRDDIGFGGNRMPVTIRHIYNANDNTENLFGMGYGWRTNFNQRLYHWDDSNAYGDYYLWEDTDGTDHYFLYDSPQKYKDEDGLELTLTTNGSGTEKYCIKDKNGNASYFDTYGRLTKQSNNQATKSNITITYTSTSGLQIASITDGAGRVYAFTYANNLLNKIVFNGKGSSELTYVNFGYTNSELTSVTDKDGKASSYTYGANHLLVSAQDIDGYKINYSYTKTAVGVPNRVAAVTEYYGSTAGGELNLEYAHNQTKLTDYNGNVQIIQFNNMGNTISTQDNLGRAQYARYAINDPMNPNGTAAAAADTSGNAKANQLLLASKLQNTVGNVLKDSSFESAILWTATSSEVTGSIDSSEHYLGSKSIKMVRSASGAAAGMYSTAFTVASGETYTFSAYVKTGNGAAYLAMHDGSTTVKSEALAANSGWTRLEVSYTNTSSAAKSVTARLMTEAACTTYMDCAQVEKAPTASRYNLIENGDFSFYGYAWDNSSGRVQVAASDKAPAPQLDTYVYSITGNPSGTNRISQTVQVSGGDGDTFVLAGWAKTDSVPIRDSREFALIATFKNGSTTVNTSTVRFNDCANAAIEWQYAASPIVAKGAFNSITVELAYDYNANTAIFDGIQLFKEEFGNSYTYDNEGNIISVKDVQKQTTTYEYTNNDLTKQVLPTGAKLEYTYDNYHNVVTAKTETGVQYRFAYDTYGNNTSVAIDSGSVTLSGSAAYTADGNRLSSTTDAAGNATTYSYHEDTNVLEWVQYPNDTAATRTEYSYDNMYRLARAEADVNTGGTLFASYGYTNDLLTSIATDSTTYSFNYGDFALRSNVGIGSRILAAYSYTPGNHFLSALDYGNGDSVNYTYDAQGRVLRQTFEDGDTVSYKYDNNGALASVTDSETGITTTYYYDYSERLLRYAEQSNDLSHSVGYAYDNINNLTELVETINGTAHSTAYAYDSDNRVTSVTNGNASTNYTYDSYGRVSQRLTKNSGSTVLTNNYTFRAGGGGTTGQIASMTASASGYNVTHSYTYDNNGNILTDSCGGQVTSYVYDSANQLLRENNQAAGKTWVWTYDNAGNITSKSEYAYTTGNLSDALHTQTYAYGDSDWGDLLTAYNGNAITYDTIGNPLTDGTWAYTWKHGRDLSTMYAEHLNGGNNDVTIGYTYNVDGLRTRKTVTTRTYAAVQHTVTFIADGVTVQTMTVNDGYVLTEADYPAVPERAGYTGSWDVYTDAVTSDVTIPVVYTAIPTYTVTFVADGVTVDTLTVPQGYVLTDDDYPSVPIKTGYTGSWSTYTTPITSDVTVTAVYTSNDTTGGTHKVTFRNPSAFLFGRTVKKMTVPHGYILTADDYPAVPARSGYVGSWPIHTDPIIANITIDVVYTRVASNSANTTDQPNLVGSDSLMGADLPDNNQALAIADEHAQSALLHNPGNGAVLLQTVTETTDYVYNGSSLSQMTVTTTGSSDQTVTLYFAYDASGTPMSVTYNGTNYYYATNLQGDVTAILNASGTAVVQYTYDAWGKLLSTSGSMASTLGDHNPLRYRGYVYDTESGLYYLQSRYYNPEVGRFINADAFASTGQSLLGNNMFVYCRNDPASNYDENGLRPHDALEEYSPVGIGIQVEIDLGSCTVGMEIILFWNVDECDENSLAVALYTYEGVSFNLLDEAAGSILAEVRDNLGLIKSGPEKGIAILNDIIKGKYSASTSGVLVFGDNNFTSVKNYEGPFLSMYGSFNHIKGAFAFGQGCYAVSLGATSCSSPSWGVSLTNYTLQSVTIMSALPY